MSTIKTHLRTAATDDQGNINLSGNNAFSGVFNLGLLLGSQDPNSQQFPMDEQGLQAMKSQLESMALDCFSGLAGIGAIIGAANITDLIQEDINRLGLAINNLALLGMEAQDHVKSIEMDMRQRTDQQPQSPLEKKKRGALQLIKVATDQQAERNPREARP